MFRKLELASAATRRVTISVDGVAMSVDEAEPIAAILLRHPPYTTRSTPISGAARSSFCMMGACFECLVEVDGQTSLRGCLTGAKEGMSVRRQLTRPDALRTVAE